jgi:predicted transcriptional regulator
MPPHNDPNVSQSSLLVDGKKVPQLKELSAHQHPEVSSIFRALSDDKSLTLFNTVALSPGNSDLLTRNLNLTRKQYYSKIERLSKQGLLARKNGKYYLTTMGKIMYELQNVVGIAVNDYWKLKSLDSVIAEKVLPEEELAKLINTLVENEGLRDIILKR